MSHELGRSAALHLAQNSAPEAFFPDPTREAMLQELLDWANKFVQRSSEWRRNSFEDSWRRWQRNADSIYDPAVANKKEEWQSKAFVPITPSHRENAQAQLFRAEVGPRPALEMKSRFSLPDDIDQSQNIRDLILREREKSRYEMERNKVLEDKTTYGSGFARIYFLVDIQERVRRVPEHEPFNVFDPGSVMRAATGQRQVIGFREEVEEVEVYRGVRFEHISIWDVFPDPKALQVKGSTIAYRFNLNYGEVVRGAQEGYYFPEAEEKLRDLPSAEQTPEDKKVVESDRRIADSEVKRTTYGTNLIAFVLQARLPKKWVLLNGEEIDDPEKLIPAEVHFHANAVLSVFPARTYDGEPNLYKDDYIPVAGQFYGRGIPEMLKDVQLVANEEVNSRIDAKAVKLALDTMIGVIEKSVVDPRDLTNGKIGTIVRLKAAGIEDIRHIFMKLSSGSIDPAAFIEPQEWERWAQERTSVNRQTLGTAGQVTDANQTLGGMQLLRAATGEKFAYLGMLSEFGFQYEIARAYWMLIYSNYGPEDFAVALGPERMQKFILLSPEEIERDYQYFPMGIYTQENRAMRQAVLSNIRTQFAGAPWLNELAFFDAMLMSADEDPARFKIPEADQAALQAQAQQMAQAQIDQADEERKVKDRLAKIANAEEAADVHEMVEAIRGEVREEP